MSVKRNTSTERIRAITDMMYQLGMYTQAMTVDALAKERDELLKQFICCESDCDSSVVPGENFCQACLDEKRSP